MNVKWEDVKADYARKDAEIETLKAMNSKLGNSLECVLNAVEIKKPAGQYDALAAMNAELVEALEFVLDIAKTEEATEYMIEMTLRKAKELNQ